MSRIYNSVVGLLCGMGILSSCEIIEYHPYDTRIEGEVGLTEKNIRLIEDKMRGRREFRFAMISDTQRRYDETVTLILCCMAATWRISARRKNFYGHGIS